MKWFTWLPGRQTRHNTEIYKKMLLFQIGLVGLFGFDIYLIKYPPNFKLIPHKDIVTWGRHYRANVILTGNGVFKCEKSIVHTDRLVIFRPDRYEHGMLNGQAVRTVLSIGWVLPDKG